MKLVPALALALVCTVGACHSVSGALRTLPPDQAKVAFERYFLATRRRGLVV